MKNNELSVQLAMLAQNPDDVENLFGASIEAIDAEPDNPRHLFYLALSFARGAKLGVALAFYQAAHRMAPDETAIMSNIGTTLSRMGRYDEARTWFERSHHILRDALSYANLASNFVETGSYERGLAMAEKAIAMDPKAEYKATRGFANLFLGHWDEGFRDYACAVDGPFRKRVDYGADDAHLIDRANIKREAHWFINGEQGVGDEIMYMGLLDEFRRLYEPASVTIDTDKRLARLFGRSFPWANVHGTRLVDVENKPWFKGAPAGSYQMPMGELCRLVGKRPEASDRGAYLVIDEDMAAMYDGLMSRHDVHRNIPAAPYPRRIGITWSGGSANTNRERRSLGTDGLKALVAMLQRKYPAATIYSLQYDPAAPDDIDNAGVDVKHFHFATGVGASYDHTAAFIAGLDLVVGVDTAAHHAAPALGIPTHTLVNDRTTWIQAPRLPDGASPWYKRATLYHQNKHETWPDTIARVFKGESPL